MTELQQRILRTLPEMLNGSATGTRLAGRLKVHRFGVSSALRSLRNQGLVGSFASDHSQWARPVWFVTAKGKEQQQ
jgi:DNA-binding MarR family transcriptional regulator